MTDILTRQIQHSNHLSHQLDELKLGIIDLVKGRLSPLILQPELLKRTISKTVKLEVSRISCFSYPYQATLYFESIPVSKTE